MELSVWQCTNADTAKKARPARWYPSLLGKDYNPFFFTALERLLAIRANAGNMYKHEIRQNDEPSAPCSVPCCPSANWRYRLGIAYRPVSGTVVMKNFRELCRRIAWFRDLSAAHTRSLEWDNTEANTSITREKVLITLTLTYPAYKRRLERRRTFP